MILGTGIDLVEHDRFSATLKRHGKRFLEKIFTARELAEGEAEHRGDHGWAARFAAKEAVFKAVSFPAYIVWHDIELLRNGHPFPQVCLDGLIGGFAEIKSPGGGLHLSITHSRTMSAAMVVWEDRPQNTVPHQPQPPSPSSRPPTPPPAKPRRR